MLTNWKTFLQARDHKNFYGLTKNDFQDFFPKIDFGHL
jgi:hypothetical protein